LFHLFLSSLSILFLYMIVLDVGGSRRVAFFSSLTLVFFPRFIAHAQNNPKDLPALFVFVVTIYMIIRVSRQGGWILCAATGCMLGLALTTTPLAVFIPLTVITWLLITGRQSISERGREYLIVLPAGKDYSGYQSIPSYQLYRDERAVSDYIFRYDCEIANTDYQLGRLFEYLEKERWFKNTLIILTADHGEALGEDDFYFSHGHSVGIDQVHVPLIISGGNLPRDKKIDLPTSNMSIFKTVLDFMRIDIPPGKQGRSLLSSDRVHDRKPVFVESLNQTGIFHGNMFYRKDRHSADDKEFWSKGNPNIAGGVWVPLAVNEVKSLDANSSEIKSDDVEHLKKELFLFEDEAAKARGAVDNFRNNVQLTPGQIKQLQSLGYVK